MTQTGEPRARILEAAEELFASRGVDGVSARDIAAAAGVAKSAVFYYYDGMDALYAAVLDRYYRAHEATLRGALEGGGDLQTRVHRVVDGYLDFISENTRYARMIQRQLAGGGGHLEPVRANLAMLLAAVEGALGDVTPPAGPLAARHFFVTLGGAVINYFTYAPALGAAWGDDPRSPAAIAERRAHLHWLVDAMLAAL